MIHPRADRSMTSITPARRCRAPTTAAGLMALAMVGLLAPPVFAQGAAALSPRHAVRLEVRVLGDGRLVVVVVNAPIADVIGAVAGAAGMDVSTAGPIPRDPVSVEFSSRPAGEILIALMNAADIDYVISGRRLVMGAPKAGAYPAAADALARGRTPALEPGEPRVDEPDAWPEGVEPVNFGAPATLPPTREALFLAVNGTEVAAPPAGTSPNVGPGRPPDRMVPVYLAPSAAAASPGTSPMPVRLQAPPTIRIPAPVVVEFPAPPRP